VVIGLTTPAIAYSPQPQQYNTINRHDSVAIHGYDPVSYFAKGGPVPGSQQFSVEYGGVKWQFASEENMRRFLAKPLRYMPMYGGYCALGAAAGYKADVKPTVWEQIDGQVYLFSSDKARQNWEKRKDKLRVQADMSWNRLRNKPVI
jgi:YHS domain-containing protein